MTMKTNAGRPFTAAILTRREFLSISAAAGTSTLSSWDLQSNSASMSKAIGLHSSSNQPLMVNVVLIPNLGGDTRFLEGIRQSLSGRSADAIVLCGLDNRQFDAIVECRAEINAASGVRKLLIHRPLTSTSISRTLEQIHRDSELFLVDGWDLCMEHAPEGERGSRGLQLSLELISRTPLMAVGMLLPERKPCDWAAVETISSFVSGFSEISFVLLPRSIEVFVSQVSERTKLGELWRNILARTNVYVRSEILPIKFNGFHVDSFIGSHRIIWGRSHPDQNVSIGSIRMAFSKLCMNRGQSGAYLGLNAARVYSLCPQHYRNT
jgi:hypothetical protein